MIDDGSNADAGGQTLNNDQRALHFLPFQKANRDEIFSTEDQARLAPAFSKQDASGQPQSQI